MLGSMTYAYLNLSGNAIARQGELSIMTDLDRGIMKFGGADSWVAVTISAVLILGAIAALIVWALQSAYAIG